METLIETVDLDVEESNELAFKIKVEGTANSPARVRLVCEGPDISYMFNGRGTNEDGVVQFIMPKMNDKLQEGIYQARVEVLIENKYFSPVQFQINFKKTVKVVAEALFLQPRIAKPEISVSAAPIVVAKPQQQSRPPEPPPVVFQKPVQTPPPVVEQKAERRSTVTPPAKSNTSSLRERYEQKIRKQVEDEDPLMEIARLHQTLKKYT
jgi:hypothetical protein